MGYWQERQEAMYKAGEMRVNKYFTRLEKAFNQTRRELQKTIDAFYFRYAEENGLSFAAAQKKLDAEELGELQDFIDLVMKNIGKYNQQVNNMSIKARITRYQALEAQVDAILRQLYAIDYEAEAEKTMQEVYGDTYYRTWYNADQYHGFHAEFAQVSPTVVEKLLEYPFNGAAFSERLWKQKDHLQAQLMEAVTTMLIQGRHPSTLAKDFAKKMQSKKFDAYRLLHTESSFLMSEATHAGYKEDGVEKYEILATLDSKTCNVCGELDNKVYEVGKEVTGVNMPPFHPLCRCTTVPHYDDTPTEGLTRAARDADGNTIEVPEDMSWKEWKREFLDEGKMQAPIIKDKLIRKAYDGFVSILANTSNENRAVLDMIMYSDTVQYQKNIALNVAFAYSFDKDVVMYNPNAPNFELYDLAFVQAHEITHRIDCKKYHSWKNARFQKAIEEASKTVYNNVDTIKEWFSDGGKYEYDMALSDIISAISKAGLNKYLFAGHSAEYWENNANVSMELLANINSIEVLGYDSAAEVRELFPELYTAYMEVVGWN